MKYTIEKILVPIDFSSASLSALDHAVMIADKIGAEVTLLHVHETQDFSSTLRKLLFKTSGEERVVIDSVEQSFTELAAKYNGKVKIATQTSNSGEKIYKQIIDSAAAIGANLIVMGTHGAKPMENFLGGSNTFRVAASAPCPVFSVHREQKFGKISHIVLPLDTSKETREKVDDAIFMAKAFGATVHLLGVSSSDDNEVQNRIRLVVNQVRHYLEEDQISCESDFSYGKNITTLTLDYAHKVNADLIMIMTEQEVNSTGFFVGPYAQQMINRSTIPVMSVRPKEKEGSFVMPY